MCKDLNERVHQAADFIAKAINVSPKFGIVLGTGSGAVAADVEIQNEFDYAQIPNFPISTAMGHKGRLILGRLNQQPIVAMDGRFHLYEGHALDDATIGIRVMHQLGVQILFITNASGGLNPQYNSGDIMIIDSHIDLMCRTSLASSVALSNQRPSRRVDSCDCQLAQSARATARASDFEIRTGVYGALLGPNYETRAEYRMLRRIGADVVGMSTVPEVNVASKLGMRILGLSIVTNVAKPDVLDITSGQEVIAAAELAAPRVCTVVNNAITDLEKRR